MNGFWGTGPRMGRLEGQCGQEEGGTYRFCFRLQLFALLGWERLLYPLCFFGLVY